MICGKCGKNVPDGSMFCPECGNKVEQVSNQTGGSWNQQQMNQQAGGSWNQQQMNQQAGGSWNQQQMNQQAGGSWNQQQQMNQQAGGSWNQQQMNQQAGGNWNQQQMNQQASGNWNQQQMNLQAGGNWNQQQMNQQAGENRNRQQSKSPEEEKRIKKRNIIIMASVGAVVLVCIVLILLSILIKPTINLNDYLSLSASGYDTMGKSEVVFDNDKFEADYGKALEKKKKKIQKSTSTSYIDKYFDFDSSSNSSMASRFLNECVGGQIDGKYTGLSNGDTIVFKWDCNDEAALEKYGYKLKYEDVEYEVTDLTEAETFDPFEGLKVTFSGIDPNACAEITSIPDDYSALIYELDKSSELSEGEIVTVTVRPGNYYGSEDNMNEEYINEVGKLPLTTSKEFTVSGIDKYVTELSQITDESLASMQSQAEDEFKAYAADSIKQEYGESLQKMDYVGDYLLVKKQNDSYASNNILYLVYKITVKNTYTPDEGKSSSQVNTFYWYISYNDLLVKTDGTVTVDVMNNDTVGDTVTFEYEDKDGYGTSWYYYGYKSIDEMYNDVVSRNADLYTCENGVNN